MATLPQQYLTTIRTKILDRDIPDIAASQQYTQGLQEAKAKDPKTFRTVSPPINPLDVNQVKGAVGSYASALPANYEAITNNLKGGHEHK